MLCFLARSPMPRRNASNCPPVLTYAAVYSRTSLLYWDSALSGELDRELLAEESDDDSELLADPRELAENEQAWVRTSIATNPAAATARRPREPFPSRMSRPRSWRGAAWRRFYAEGGEATT